MKLLATADLHLGKFPTQLPQELRKRASCAEMWEKIVQLAINQKVDAVLIAGDLIDAANRFFEAVGSLEAGLKKLCQNEISVYAIAGNHDYDTLSRVHETINFPSFHLLGKNGSWEITTHKNLIQIAGFSFTSRYMDSSPLPDFPHSDIDQKLPIIGMLHADLDNPVSRYAPVTKEEFSRTNVPLWILGHLHKPEKFSLGCGTELLYAGSPQGMDPGPGEAGAHGPWIIHIKDGKAQFEHHPLAPVQYDELEVNLDGVSSTDSVQAMILNALKQHVAEVRAYHSFLECLSLRVHFIGTTPLDRKKIRQCIAPLIEEGVRFEEIPVFINKLTIETDPPLDYKAISQGDQISAQLAKLILSIENETLSKQDQELIKLLHETTTEISKENVFSSYPLKPLTKDALIESLNSFSKELLGELHV